MPVRSMPSATPSLSMFTKKGVTKDTYLAPDHFLSRLGAQFSVDPPTLSRMKSNLKRKMHAPLNFQRVSDST